MNIFHVIEDPSDKISTYALPRLGEYFSIIYFK